MIVTCSHDRNAFVWTWDSTLSEWKPSLVILRIDRAAIDVKWSPDGQKFAVASGAKSVPVCYYEANHTWWVSKMIKKHKSTVTKIAWHPTGMLLATTSTDFKCRVFSSYIKDVDGENQVTGPFLSPAVFGEEYKEYGCLGWANAVTWDSGGNKLAFTGHDSSLHVIDYSGCGGDSGVDGGERTANIIRHGFLPFNEIGFINNDSEIVGVGHDSIPMVFKDGGDGAWKFDRKCCKAKKTSIGAVASTASNVSAARSLFQNKVSKGEDSSSKGSSAIASKEKHGEYQVDESEAIHENPIVSLRFDGFGSGHGGFSTSGMDGRVCIWEGGDVGASVAGITEGVASMNKPPPPPKRNF